MKVPREMRHLIQECRDNGWTVEKTRNGHIRFVSPAGEVVMCAGTPSDGRARKNHLAHLKRCACPPTCGYN